MLAVNWEFSGSTTQQAMSVASVIATAMERHQTLGFSSEVVAMACEILGCEWDRASVLAVVQNCSFEAVL